MESSTKLKSSDLQKKLAVDTHSDQAELFASRYSSLEEDAYHDCFVYSRRRLNLWLDRYLPERGDGLRMLDLGCGTGYHMARYRERGFDLAGVDGSDGMLAQARITNPGVEFRQGDVDKIPYPDDQFDFVLCVEVLRYLPDIAPCVREIARVLKPGGTALVTAAPPLQANCYWAVNRITSLIKVGDLTHLKQFFHSAGRLRRGFADAGFASAEVHGVYGGPMIWLERLAPRAMPKVLRAWEPVDAKTVDAPLLRSLANMYLVVASARQ